MLRKANTSSQPIWLTDYPNVNLILCHFSSLLILGKNRGGALLVTLLILVEILSLVCWLKGHTVSRPWVTLLLN